MADPEVPKWRAKGRTRLPFTDDRTFAKLRAQAASEHRRALDSRAFVP
jgi:hypothetical protein